MIDLEARPRLAPGVRLQADRVRGGSNLLAPEQVLRVNPTSAAVLELCDGERALGTIVDRLYADYSGDRQRIEDDVLALVGQLAARRLVVT